MNGYPFETQPLSDVFGVEICGVDVSGPLEPGIFAAIHNAFYGHSVLLFRGQSFTPESLIDFSKNFGDIDLFIDPQYRLDGYPEVIVVGNVMVDGLMTSLFINIDEEWHTDRSYMTLPSLGSLFYAVEAPPEGAATRFASAYAAYDALPAETKMRIDGLRAVHDMATLDVHLRTQDPTRPPLTDAQRREVPPVSHPLVRTHPVTGRKSLFICPEVISEVEGLPMDEGRELLLSLTTHASQPRFVYTHEWQNGDLVVWDNRCTLHTATSYDTDKYRRVMWRTTIEGDAPR